MRSKRCLHFHISLAGNSTRKPRVRRNLSHTVDTVVADRLASACSAANGGNTTVPSLRTDNSETDAVQKRTRRRSVQVANENCEADDMSSDNSFKRVRESTRIVAGNSNANSVCLLRLGKSSSASASAVESDSSMPVVQQSTSATTTAAAGSSACSVVLQRLSVASVQHTSKSMTVGNRHSEKAVTASRGKRHICVSEDDVESIVIKGAALVFFLFIPFVYCCE